MLSLNCSSSRYGACLVDVINIKKFILMFVIALNFLCFFNAQAANHFIRQGATGNGQDWANAYGSLPATLIRGDTYYIGSGSYPGRVFDTPSSGTLPIIIKGATAADHGGAVSGWSNSYSVNAAEGGSQAIWTSQLVFNTSYWVFDGMAGPTWSKNPSQYGFRINPTLHAIRVFNTNSITSDIKISHIAAIAPVGDSGKLFLWTDNGTKSVNNIAISHCLADGWTNTVMATSVALPMTNWLFEYNVVLNGFSSEAWHGEDLNNNFGYLDNFVVRYNWFEGRRTGTGSIVCLNARCGAYYIYGNVFKNMSGGDGIITGVHFPLSGKIYNNTFDTVDSGWNNGQWIGHDVTATVYNNILYNSIGSVGPNTFLDYNNYFNVTNPPKEAHGIIGSGSPFVAAGTDYRLKAATDAGFKVSSPSINFGTLIGNITDNSMDIDGKIRGTDGTWDRGAFEFGSASMPPDQMLKAPLNLRIISSSL